MKRQNSPNSVERGITIGLLADKGVPTQVAKALAQELPSSLQLALSSEIAWKVEYRSESLPLDEEGKIRMHDIDKVRRRIGWDVAIVLTDLPRRVDMQPIVSDYSVELNVALLSIPALGVWQVRRRSHDLVVHLLRHLLEKRLNLDGGHSDTIQYFGAVRHIQSKDAHVDEHLALEGIQGRTRLLAGMVLDNRPWRLVPHLASATAAAAATAAYGVITTSFWTLATALPSWRLGLLNILAITVMVTWLLFYNHLWERPVDKTDREKVFLYNLSTVVTLAMGVACMYLILYILTLVATFVIIDPSFLSKQIGYASTFGDYVVIAWLASSVGIVAGALGSSFESEEATLKATYGKRERERQRKSRGLTANDDDKDK